MLWSMVKDKVSGPNGFSLLFFRKYYLIIQVEVAGVVRKFFATRGMPSI